MMKISILILAIVFVFSVNAQTPVARKPPMGWNSYNCYGSAVHENEVKENADYIAKNLKSFGWEYVVVDFLWSYDNPPGSKIGNPFQLKLEDGSSVPWLAMDDYGRLLPHVNKFPSAFKGNGFESLSKYVHSLGLKFGIHVMRGVPRQAVWAKTPVLGTDGITSDKIADTSSKCEWLNHMYGLDMHKKGSQEYLNSILQLYALWEVDFIKVDDISREYKDAEIEGYQKAIQNCGRQIVLSVSPGETPVAKSSHVKKYTNMWRMADDFWDDWKQLLKMFEYAKNWEGVGDNAHWPDCDMIQIGKLSKRGPVGEERYSRFNENELYTHFSFWSIYRSPLILGGNLPENREIEKKLFTNEEVIAVNQTGRNPKQLFKDDKTMIWTSEVTNSKDINIGMFNISDTTQNVTLDIATLGYKTEIILRDLWKKKDIGMYKKYFNQNIPPHGCLLLKASAKD